MIKWPPGLAVAGIFVFVLFAVVTLTVFVQTALPERNFQPSVVVIPGEPMRMDFRSALEFRETLELVKLLLTTLNIVLLAYLLANYTQIYLASRSNFSMGLLVMVSALLAHAISQSPVVSQLFGFRGSGLGPFAIVPSIFTLIAALVLVYLSKQ